MYRSTPVGHTSQIGCSLNIFTEDDLLQLHLATLELMETVGVRIDSADARQYLRVAGAWVDEATNIVKFPPHLVEDAIISAPKRFLLAGRDPKNDVVLDEGRVNFSPFLIGVKMQDPYTGEVKDSVRDDLVKIATVSDYLDQMCVVQDAVVPRDRDPELANVYALEANLNYTTKCIGSFPESKRAAQICIEMAGMTVGGVENLKERPVIFGGGCPTSPLIISEGLGDVIIEFAKARVPFDVGSMALAGGTGPMTLAGTLVTQNCEDLAGIVLSQSVNRGTPIFYSTSSTNLDMRKGNAPIGSPELALFAAGAVALGHYYHFPVWVAGG